MDSPPRPSGEYFPENALDDLPAIRHAEDLFLNSNMAESEKYCLDQDPKKERLYITSGYCLIQCLKAIMSYEDEDLQEASRQVKHGNNLAYQHRSRPAPLLSRVVGLIWENPATGVSYIKNMTPVERHAELLYAETLFAKALLGVVCSGSWLSFLTEALSFRTMINIYLRLGKFLDVVDADAQARDEGPEDISIDKDFRSGVELGVGACNLLLSLMPERLISVAEIFGYKGDREAGLGLLMKAGGWVKGEKVPRVSIKHEGLRRVLSDICLLCFHLVVSSITYRGVDLEMAQIILDWNLRRYPNGVFFLFAQGRLAILHSQPALALESHARALSAQSQYRSLHYISYWELAMAHYGLWDVSAALEQWQLLEKEATWSKACYIYGVASCLLQLGTDGAEGMERQNQAEILMERIPGVVHKIAGKSIPIEKFVARKARKFKSQGNKLLLPALELAYMFLAIDHAPRSVLIQRMLPDIDRELNGIKDQNSNKHGYWDDFCLSHLLRGVCWRFVAYPDKDAIVSPADGISPWEQREAEAKALASLQQVIEHGSKIQLDHYVLYHAHYELGRLRFRMGELEEARRHLDLVVSGKSLEAEPNARKVSLPIRARSNGKPIRSSTRKPKGKYSMQSAAIMRATAVLEELDQQRKLSL